MAFRGKLRDTFFITGRSPSKKNTDLESPTSSTTTFPNSAFEPDNHVLQTGHPDPHQTTSNGAYEMIIRHDTDRSDRYEALTEEKSTQNPRCGISWLKFALLATVIIGAITGIIILITALRDTTPPGHKNVCTALNVSLNQSIIIVCYTSYKNDLNISITPPPTASLSLTVLLNKQQLTNSGWTMSYISNKNITLKGPEAKCSSEGEYKIIITDIVERSSSIQTTNLEINVNPELNVTTPNASREANCRSHSQCKDGYTLKMLPSTYPATEFNQTCYADYSDSIGWITRCTGQLRRDINNASCTITCILSKNTITIDSKDSIC
ncbi:hypothetical protein CHS0354_003687 [Potamilus streckersoni]|uniref:Uncharacterized protein n=1 Tax=Potamilus streckersoni TaxID=2493646 RepID=A0AAE0SSF6_9BIVA|nr:hypothetical protein CHS0354_003687 [Potamilus streckersoni]